MKLLLPYFLISLFSLFSLSPSHAQIGGDNTYDFLNLTQPARVTALGGTLIAVKDNDLNLSFQNPSLLDSTMHNCLALNYSDYFADIQYGYAAYSRTFKNIGSFSTGIQFVDYGNFTESDIYGNIYGQFTGAEYALNLSYSRSIDSLFSVGAALKTIYSKLYDYLSYGNALDLGATYNNQKHLFTAALVIKNIGRQWKTYSAVREPFPFEIQLGVSKKLAHAPFRLNFTATHLEKWDLTFVDPAATSVDPITGETIDKSKFSKFADKLARHIVFGAEILLTKNFHLRMGYNYRLRQELMLESRPGISGFSFGFGIKIYKFHLSYGYARFHPAGGPNRFTITTNLSEFYSKKQ